MLTYLCYFSLKYLWLGPLFRVLYRPWTEGVENIPKDGPAIIACNHTAFMDNLFLPLMCPRKIIFLAKSEYYTTPGIKGFCTRAFMTLTGQIPIDRSSGSAAEGALRTGLEVLKDGKLLGIYPEGTRSPDGRLYRGKTGVARLALESGVPVIPVALIGSYEVQPLGRKFPKLFGVGRVGLRVGKPLDFSRYAGMQGDRFVERSITDEILYEIMQLGGQEYVDVDAARLKKQKKAQEKQDKGAPDTAKRSHRIPDTKAG